MSQKMVLTVAQVSKQQNFRKTWPAEVWNPGGTNCCFYISTLSKMDTHTKPVTNPHYFSNTAVANWGLIEAYLAYSTANPKHTREEISSCISSELQEIAEECRNAAKAERARQLLSACGQPKPTN